MKSRTRSRAALLVGVGVLASLLAAEPWAGGAARDPANPSRGTLAPPSVVLITLDTVRADHLGCYGYSRAETPSLDSLAGDAVRFANAYTVVPITLPSHAVILTGTYPMWNGVRDFTSPGLPPRIPTLAEAMRQGGYATAAFVSAYVLDSIWGLNRGFDLYDDQMDLGTKPGGDLFLVTRAGDVTTGRMLTWLEARAHQPFFIWLHLYDAHSPYRSPEPYRSRHAGHPYDGAIAFDDAQVARVAAGLRRLGLYDHTLLIVMSDHGESLGEHGEAEHGFFIYNATLRIPLLVKWPGQREHGRVVTHPVSSIDIAPTIARLCGLPASATGNFQGRSLIRWMDPRATSNESVYGESYYARDSFAWHELRALVTPEFKFIDAPEPELYALGNDPGERSNVFKADQAMAASLRASLQETERRFEAPMPSNQRVQLDPEALEKLKSLGYVAYQAGTTTETRVGLADPKQKIAIFNDILRAGDLRRAGRHAEAAVLLEEVKKREPRLYVVPFEAGENDLGWGKPQEAVGEFRAALQLNPTFDQALLGLGRACFEIGKDQEAATALELALRLNPRNSLARLDLAKVYFRQGAFEKAEGELTRVVAQRPDYAEAHSDYGVTLAKRRDYAGALKEIRRGLELGYRDAIALNYQGIALAELGRPNEAIQSYREALKLDPRYAAAWLNLAIEYRRQGQDEEAQGAYRKVCELNDQLCREHAAQFARQ